MTKKRKNSDQFSPSSILDTVDIGEEDLHKELQNLLKNDKAKFNMIQSETTQMIPQIDDRIHYWEDRRTQFLQLALAIIAAASAGILILVPEVLASLLPDTTTSNPVSENLFVVYFYSPFVLFFFVLVIGSIVLLVRWNNQNNPPYPFTKGTKTWKWHYRHAEETPNQTDCNKFSDEVFEQEAIIFAKNLNSYKTKFIENSEIELLDQNLSQLYLLLINEKFKIKFVSQLRDLLLRTINMSVIVLTLSAILSAILYFSL